jgi:hypothetical protein
MKRGIVWKSFISVSVLCDLLHALSARVVVEGLGVLVIKKEKIWLPNP